MRQDGNPRLLSIRLALPCKETLVYIPDAEPLKAF